MLTEKQTYKMVASRLQDCDNGAKSSLWSCANIKNPAGWAEYDKYGIDELRWKGYDGCLLEDGEKKVGFVFDSSNQVKLTTNKKPTTNADIRFSLKDIDNYTEKQYNDFGWARVNEVLTYRENGNFRTEYAKIKRGTSNNIHKTASGEIIVAVNDMVGKEFGVDNVLVYAKGSYQNYQITKVVRINLNNETDIEIVRDYIYERESSRTRESTAIGNYYEEELIREYRLGDFADYQELKRERRESQRNSVNDR